MNRIILSSAEYERLATLSHALKKKARVRNDLVLDQRLNQVMVLDGDPVERDQVSMGSAVTLVDSESGEVFRFTLVFPESADIAHGRLSILTPLGSALLGRRTGETFSYECPGGTVTVQVQQVTAGKD